MKVYASYPSLGARTANTLAELQAAHAVKTFLSGSCGDDEWCRPGTDDMIL